MRSVPSAEVAALALALALLAATPARAQAAAPTGGPAGAGIEPRPAACRPLRMAPWPSLDAAPLAPDADPLTLSVEADRLSGEAGRTLRAEGAVRLQRGNLRLQADRIDYRFAEDRVRASGQVDLQRGGDRYRGDALDIDTRRAEGHVTGTSFRFARTEAGGRAERVDFRGPDRLEVQGVSYSSCELPEDQTAPWVLTTRRLRVDFQANEGLAEDAVLRFYGLPILALPVLSFPVTGARKSGWLPPRIDLASTSGLELALPYYWNIAPDTDATLTPTLYSKRGLGLETEVRYLRERDRGETRIHALPNDISSGGPRWAIGWQHAGSGELGIDYDWQALRVSDRAYWRDGLRGADSLTPRLLPSQAQVRQRRTLASGAWGEAEQLLYLRGQTWQTLQGQAGSDAVDAPFRLGPRVGALWSGLYEGVRWSAQTEVNRFDHQDATQPTGQRAHTLLSVAWPWGDDGWQITPRLGLNGAAYRFDRPLADSRTAAGRWIPTFSLDNAWVLERPVQAFGAAYTQTLEPRLLYVHTPWREQGHLPLYDSAPLDFNATTLFADNAFSGVDRVSDAHQVTAGISTRLIEAATGTELAQLGVAQRYLLRDQRITPDGLPQTERFSDILLLGSTAAIPRWVLEASMQYDPEQERVVRSIASARYSPGPWRTLYFGYRLQRGTSEQASLGWQWPLRGLAPGLPDLLGAALPIDARAGTDCGGTLYGVGRMDYSMRDRRTSGLIAGLEYDAGCWIGRVVASRQSTGLNQSTTRLMLQLELVGLSRLGTNPLAVLKDNIPGYQLLNEPRGSRSGTAAGDLRP